MARLEDWKRGLNETKSDLNREEWKFLRFAQLQCTTTGSGVLGFIINRDYLDGIAKRRLREHLGETFPLRTVVDLNGDVKGNIADENVFEIEQGVCISVFSTRHTKSVLRFHSEVGTREQKYKHLLENKSLDGRLVDLVPQSPYFRWVPYGEAHTAAAGDEYEKWFPVNHVFSVMSSGIQTKNDAVCIAWNEDEILRRVKLIDQLSPNQAAAALQTAEDGVWTVAKAKADLQTFGVDRTHVRRVLYRPFDWRFTYYTRRSSGFLGRPRYDVMQHMLGGKNVGLIFNRQIVGGSISQFGVSRDLIAHGTFYLGNKGQDYLAPLWLNSQGKLGAHRQSNFTPTFIAAISESLRSDAAEAEPETAFNYIYAVFHSNTYRARYAEFLKIDFPRVPFPSALDLFRHLGRLGSDLAALHLLEAGCFQVQIATFTGPGNPEVEKVTYTSGTVWLDKKQTCGFAGVPEAVWNFHIGGYQVCQKWLKDRKGRRLSTDDIAHYQKIVVALSETIRLMKEIDETIEKHGGWPGAFVTGKAASPQMGQQSEQGLAVLFALALLHTWGVPADRRAFELGMLLMQRDALRERIVKRQKSVSPSTAASPSASVGRMDEFIGELVGSNTLRVENRKSRQLVGLGTQAPAKHTLVKDSIGANAFAKATQAVEAVAILAEQGQSLDLYTTAEDHGSVEIAIS